MAHRDGWVLDNLNRLRRTIDPEGERAERLALQTRIATLSSSLQTQPLSTMARANLVALRDALLRDQAALRTAAPTSSQDGRALAEMSAAIVRIADAAKSAAAPAGEAATPPAAPTEESAGGDPRALRGTQIRAARRPRRGVGARHSRSGEACGGAARPGQRAALRRPHVSTAADVAALRERLRALDDILRGVRGLPDQQAASDAAAIASLA